MKNLVMIAAVLSFTGCASTVSPSKYAVNITSEPSNLPYELKDLRKGEVISSGKTPNVVMLKSGAGYFKPAHYQVNYASFDEQPSKEFEVKAKINPWYYGNIFFGGIIGMLGVDPVTGAMYKLPNQITNSEANTVKTN